MPRMPAPVLLAFLVGLERGRMSVTPQTVQVNCSHNDDSWGCLVPMLCVVLAAALRGKIVVHVDVRHDTTGNISGADVRLAVK